MAGTPAAMRIHAKWRNFKQRIIWMPATNFRECLQDAIACLIGEPEVENMGKYKLIINGAIIDDYLEEVLPEMAAASDLAPWILEYGVDVLDATSLDASSFTALPSRAFGSDCDGLLKPSAASASDDDCGALSKLADTVFWIVAGQHFRLVNREAQAGELLSAFCEMESIRKEVLPPSVDR
jgi:hypothetical protein